MAAIILLGIGLGVQKLHERHEKKKAEKATLELDGQYANGSTTRSERNKEGKEEKRGRSKSGMRREKNRNRSSSVYSEREGGEQEAPPPSYDAVFGSAMQTRRHAN